MLVSCIAMPRCAACASARRRARPSRGTSSARRCRRRGSSSASRSSSGLRSACRRTSIAMPASSSSGRCRGIRARAHDRAETPRAARSRGAPRIHVVELGAQPASAAGSCSAPARDRSRRRRGGTGVEHDRVVAHRRRQERATRARSSSSCWRCSHAQLDAPPVGAAAVLSSDRRDRSPS